MITRRKISALVAVGAIAAMLFWLFLKSEEDVIRGVFDVVAETFNREQNESPFDSLARARKLCAFMVPEGFQFGVEDMGGTTLKSREEGVQIVALVRQGCRLHVEFSDLDIVPGPVDAVVRGTLDCSGCDASFALHKPRVRSFVAHMKKVDGDWRFSKVSVLSNSQNNN